MTRGGGKDALERSRGIGKDEKQPVIVRLAAQWRRSNLVILVAFRKGKHLGESCEKGPKKRFIQNREELFTGAP